MITKKLETESYFPPKIQVYLKAVIQYIKRGIDIVIPYF